MPTWSGLAKLALAAALTSIFGFGDPSGRTVLRATRTMRTLSNIRAGRWGRKETEPADSAAQSASATNRRSDARSFLLTMPQYNGTLAAARCLGRRGIGVTIASNQVMAPARWSRHVSRHVNAPDVADPDQFLQWLIDFGKREPGHVLYPTCDELAWLLAKHANELGRYFRLYQPSVETMWQLLDKAALHKACIEVGIPVLPTAFPRHMSDVLRAGVHIGFPLLLKPRTQVLFSTRSKGAVVTNAKTLQSDYENFVSRNHFHPSIANELPGVRYPLLQAYRERASDSIYSLAGFIGPNENEVVARAAIKILQRPSRLGTGLCFDEAAVDLPTLDALVRLCRKVGYFGVFEAEFVPDDGKLHLVDFNPRFYGQMGFEVGRQLPLAYLVWLGARGEHARLKQVIEEAARWQEGRGYVYCHRFYLNFLIAVRSLCGRMNRAEVQQWRSWLNERARERLAFDATHAADDRLPALVSAVHELRHAIRHPRSFLLANVLDT
jgi:predicted ATP-grasp superfamily ATP-dependent carboligase